MRLQPLILSSLICLGCAHRDMPSTKEHGDVKLMRLGEIDYSKVRPAELLSRARKSAWPISVGDAPAGWLTLRDAAELLKSSRAQAACAPIGSVYSSHYPTDRSTVGREALFLIEGLRTGHFPPAGCSEDTKLTPEEAERWFESASR